MARPSYASCALQKTDIHSEKSILQRPLRQISLEEPQFFRCRMQLLKIAATPFSDRPLRLVTQPAETQVKPRSSQSPPEVGGSCPAPAGLLIGKFALPHEFRAP